MKGYYPGCSAKLRNGTIAHNIWHTPQCSNERQYSSLKPDFIYSKQASVFKIISNTVQGGYVDLAWWDNGTYDGCTDTDCEHDIMEVLPMKYNIPPRDTPDFNTYMAQVVTSKLPLVFSLKGKGNFTPCLKPSWDWARYDYAVEEREYKWFTTNDIAQYFGKRYVIRQVGAADITSGAVLIDAGQVVFGRDFGTDIRDANYLVDGKPKFEISPDLGQTWELLGVKA